MQHTNPSLNKSTDWQMLGELELPVGSDIQNIINSRLTEILTPLKLQADFLNRILKSAQSAGVHAGESNGAAREFGHIHFTVFAPLSHEIDGKTWGFFRIEKLQDGGQDKSPTDHSIEFYLYIEGK